MRDRDAKRVALDTFGRWGAIVEVIEGARARLIEYDAAGYPAGVGESSIGSNRKSDPVARTIEQTAVLEKAKPGEELDDRRQIGWKSTDEFGDQRRNLDKRLQHLHDETRKLLLECEEIVRIYAGPGEEGCFFCDALRLPINADTGKAEHKCDEHCADRNHRPQTSHQKIYTRRAPKPPPDADEAEIERYGALQDLPRCSFHHEFAERYGVDANVEIGIWHLEHLGERTPYALIRRHHAREFNRYHGVRRQSDRAWLGGQHA